MAQRYRVHQVLAVVGFDPSERDDVDGRRESDRLVARAHSPADAELIVEALNRMADQQ